MSPKATIIWCVIILFFSLITFYYGGIDALVASGLIPNPIDQNP